MRRWAGVTTAAGWGNEGSSSLDLFGGHPQPSTFAWNFPDKANIIEQLSSLFGEPCRFPTL